MKAIFAVFVIACMVVSSLAASEYRTVRRPVVVDDTFTGGTVVEGGAPVEKAPFIMPPGTVLDSSYYDWQRNGSLNRRIWVNADGSVHATYMKSPDAGWVERGMVYYDANELG